MEFNFAVGNQQNDDNDVKEKGEKTERNKLLFSSGFGQSGVYKNGFIFGYCGEDIIRDGPIKSLSTVRWPFVFFLGRLTNS